MSKKQKCQYGEVKIKYADELGVKRFCKTKNMTSKIEKYERIEKATKLAMKDIEKMKRLQHIPSTDMKELSQKRRLRQDRLYEQIRGILAHEYGPPTD